MKAPFLRTPYNYDTNKAGDEDAIHCKDKSLAQQQFAAESDINNIMKRFEATGQLPDGQRAPTYMDFEGIFDFHSAMNAISGAQQTFNMLPAKLRARFHNDPGEFVDFCSDETNRAEAERLGLVVPKAIAQAIDDTNPPLTPAPGPDGPPAGQEPASRGKTDPKKKGQ